MKPTEELRESEEWDEIEITNKVFIHKTTGNLMYPCQKCGKSFDMYIHLTDPTEDPNKIVNMLCKDCKKKWRRRSAGVSFVAFLLERFFLRLDKIEGKFVEIQEKGEEKLRELTGWTF